MSSLVEKGRRKWKFVDKGSCRSQTAKEVISRGGQDENVREMLKYQKRTSMQNMKKYCFSTLNRQICDVLVTVFVVVRLNLFGISTNYEELCSIKTGH